MQTVLLTPKKDCSDLVNDDAVTAAAELLQNGMVVGIPTETVYGLAADAFNPQAVKKIFAAKGRPADNPLIVHISKLSQLDKIVAEVPEKAMILAEKFWPGPLTIIMKKRSEIPDVVSAGLATVAVRMPSHPVAAAIITASKTALAAPSANISGLPSPTEAAHVMRDMNGKIPAVVDGGSSAVGVESTVISLAGERPRLLRPGGISLDMLREAIGEVDLDEAVLGKFTGAAASAPGMKYKHYSPNARVILLNGGKAEYIDYVNNHAADGVFALCFDEDMRSLNVPYITYGGQDDPNAQAHLVFAALREMDDRGAKTVYAHCPQKSGVAMAVYNRLIRAAAFEIINL